MALTCAVLSCLPRLHFAGGCKPLSNWRIHKLKALRTHQPINASNEAALAQIGHLASTPCIKDVQEQSGRSGASLFTGVRTAPARSSCFRHLPDLRLLENTKCNKGVPRTEE
jgi:hypothetical protein